MTKIDIDNVKMWESILRFNFEAKVEDIRDNPVGTVVKFIGDSIKHALKEQGLEYNDGKIVRIEPDDPETDFGNKNDLTEFEQALGHIIRKCGGHLGTVNDDKLKKDANELLEIARKTILAEEIELAYKTRDDMQFQKGYEAGYEYGRKQSLDVDVDEMVLEFKTDGNIHPCDFQIDAYRKGINDVIKLIKEE